MKADVADKVCVLKKVAEFEHLSDEAVAELATLGSFCVFKKGAYIFREQDASRFHYVVKSGRVKLFKQSPSGRQFITRFSNPGQTLNAIVLFTQSPHFVSARAVDETTLLRVKAEDYMSFVYRHPSHALKVLTLSGKTLNSAWGRIMDLVGESVKQRVLDVLCALSNKFGDTLAFTCSEIAELSGTTTETTIRIMKELTSLNILEHTRGTIRVLDTTELKKLSQTAFDI